MKKTSNEIAQDATNVQPKALFARRSLLKGTVAGAAATAGLAASSLVGMNIEGAEAKEERYRDSVYRILTVARTLERLAVTLVTHGIEHAEQLGLSGATLMNVKAVLIEEQIHEFFLYDQGAGYLASEFSFPYGPETFEHLPTFLNTLAEIGGNFDTVYLAAVKELAELGRPRLAQIAAQIAWVEGEHLALGRQIGIDFGLIAPPANNWAFAPSLIPSVGSLPAIAREKGYLSPRPGNRYIYHPVSTYDTGVIHRRPFAAYW